MKRKRLHSLIVIRKPISPFYVVKFGMTHYIISSIISIVEELVYIISCGMIVLLFSLNYERRLLERKETAEGD